MCSLYHKGCMSDNGLTILNFCEGLQGTHLRCAMAANNSLWVSLYSRSHDAVRPLD